MKAIDWVLAVTTAAVIALAVAMMCFALSSRARAGQQHEVVWVLGICQDDAQGVSQCRRVGQPFDDQGVCESLRDSLRKSLNTRRVHCVPTVSYGQNE